VKRPVIGITCEPDIVPPFYEDTVRRAGGEPLQIAPGTGVEILDAIDGLIISGGTDVDIDLYGGSPHPEQQERKPIRDQMEIDLLKRAIERDFPTFCICRGSQVLNVVRGGTLHQHVPDVYGETVVHRDVGNPCFHPVTMEADSLVSRIIGRNQTRVHSIHHQAIADLGADLVVTARSPDGVIEAVELPGHSWLLAVQWHPERSAASDPDQQVLFDTLVRRCR